MMATARKPSDLRVAHVDHSISRGGAEYALMRVARNATWRPMIVLPNPSPDMGPYAGALTNPDASVIFLGPAQSAGASKSRGVRAILRFAGSVVGQAIAIRGSRAFRSADIIHANTSRAAVYCALACMTSKKPLVVHLRDMVDIESLGRLGYILFTRLALRRANGVIGNSRSTLSSATRWISAKTASAVIPSPIGLAQSPTVTTTSVVVSSVGMIARIDPWKGQELLIRAFAKVFEGSETRLILAGAAEFGHEKYLDQLHDLAAELSISDQVDFLGHVADVTACIRSLDICVQASIRPEPLGQNVLQYLASGRPTIAVAAGGPSEWIDHGVNGILFPSGDVEQLSAALESLSEDEDLRKRLSLGAANTPGLLSDLEVAELHGDFFARLLDADHEEGRAHVA